MCYSVEFSLKIHCDSSTEKTHSHKASSFISLFTFYGWLGNGVHFLNLYLLLLLYPLKISFAFKLVEKDNILQFFIYLMHLPLNIMIIFGIKSNSSIPNRICICENLICKLIYFSSKFLQLHENLRLNWSWLVYKTVFFS